MNIKELIQKHKAQKDPNSINWPELVKQMAEAVIEKRLEGIKEELRPAVTAAVEKAAADILKKNMKGDPGDRGPIGLPGRSIQGPQGKPGKNGKSIRGPRGFNGNDGVGKPGKDGSPDKPEQIAHKLNTLEGAIDQKVIKGLSLTLRNLFNGLKEKNRSRSQGGGGIGNPQHETKNVSSATTTVTLSYGVAAGGRMIWAYYQGQNLVYGTHYTISGKTMTLLFTPQDSTFIDITYIRA